MSSVGGRLFGVVIRADSLMECCLEEVTGSIMKVVVAKMVVEVITCSLRERFTQPN